MIVMLDRACTDLLEVVTLMSAVVSAACCRTEFAVPGVAGRIAAAGVAAVVLGVVAGLPEMEPQHLLRRKEQGWFRHRDAGKY